MPNTTSFKIAQHITEVDLVGWDLFIANNHLFTSHQWYRSHETMMAGDLHPHLQ